MADIMSILQSSYQAAPQPIIPVGAKFGKVDPTQYQGTWTGKDYKNQPFTVSITKISGVRANVVYQSSAGLQSQRVFITSDSSFRIGDSKFQLTGTGTAKISTIVTDPNTGNQTLDTAPAQLQT
jgi:hypothetical protein